MIKKLVDVDINVTRGGYSNSETIGVDFKAVNDLINVMNACECETMVISKSALKEAIANHNRLNK